MDIGLGQVCRIDTFPLDMSGTGIFSFPCGETDINLEVVALMLGVRSDEAPLLCDPLSDSRSVWGEVHELLGDVRPKE
ncbi:hypothetical protein AMTRI_Chr04g183220 [Amborella trichopoda]